MTKILPKALAASALALLLGTAALPTYAATGFGSPASNPYCDATSDDISESAASLTRALEAKGYEVQDLSAWSGCLRATVTENGVSKTLILDPHFLQPAGSQPS